MPNQPKTPVSSFRLSEETKESLRRMNKSMTRRFARRELLVERAEASTRQTMEEFKRAGLDASEYPFEAYIEGLQAYRDALNIEPGVVLPSEVDDVVNAVIAATWPIICAEKLDDERRRSLVDVIQR